MSGRKIFVGSLPDGIVDSTLRATFQQYGQIEDIYIKQGCELGRQWAFITFAAPDQAQFAKESCDRILTFPGAERSCDVMVARNQGMFGQSTEGGGASAPQVVAPSADSGPKKIFVGSLPDGITGNQLQTEFSKYGVIVDTYVKEGCEPGRQWAFVTFSTHQEAQLAKVSTDRILVMPGAARACEVTLARNQGMFGQEPVPSVSQGAMMAAPSEATSPKKIFVGSLPDNIQEQTLRWEFERYGTILDVFLKTGCEPGRQWAFVTFASTDQAILAKESTDRKLMLPGADRACEVMLAKNQGKFGQEPTGSTAGASPTAGPYVVPPTMGAYGYAQAGSQPPPPNSPPPAHLTPWRCYHTAAGLPYYHNHATGVTQWECPPNFQVTATTGQARYSPY